MLSATSVNAQINTNKALKNVNINKRKIPYNPVYPKMDKVIKEIIDAGAEGTFKITMASLTLTKYVDTRSKYIGSTSYSIVSSSNKFFKLRKYDELTAEGSFYVDGTTEAANLKVFTTKLGGQKMTVRHTSGPNEGLVYLRNIKIIKKGLVNYIITGDAEKNGNTTNYIFNIYRHVIQ